MHSPCSKHFKQSQRELIYAGITTEFSRIMNKPEHLIAEVGRSARRHYYLWMHQVGLCSEDLMSFGKTGRMPYGSVKTVP